MSEHEQHAGGYVWRNGAEMEWECEEHCPHPDHDDDLAATPPGAPDE